MNPISQSKVAKNTGFLTIAFIFQKILSFFYFAYLASYLGSDNIGKYSWALSFCGIFALLIEFGLGPVLTREISRDHEKAKSYLANIIGIKLLLTVIIVGTLLITLSFLGRDQITEQLVYLGIAIIVLDSFTFSFYSIFRAYQIMTFEAIGVVIYQAIIVAAGVISVLLGFYLKSLVTAVLLGSIFNFFYSQILLIKKTKIRPTVIFNWEIIKKLLRFALPFALAGVFYKLYTQIDTVLLGLLAGDRYVGWYTVASKFNISLTFIPGAVAMSFFPAMSAYFVSSKEKLTHTFEQAMIYLMLISLPITAGALVLADSLILKLYGPAFEASISALRIIIIGLTFAFLNYPVGNFLNACNRQTLNTVNMGIATLFNIIANVILIQRYNYIGAAIASLATAVLLVSLGIPHVSRIAPYSKKLLFGKFFKGIFASGIMAIVIYMLKPSVHILIIIPLSIIIYFVILYITRGVTKDDLITIYRSVLKKAT